MKPYRTWILIADAARAHVYAFAGPGKGLKKVEGMTIETEHKRAHEIGSDKPGRAFESVGTARHAVSPRSDLERIEEQRFAARIIERLDKAREQSSFDRLVLVAPPTMLGDLREHLTTHLAKCVSATLNKDLTKIPEATLADHLAEVLPV